MTVDPHEFAEEFAIVIPTYQPVFSGLYQLGPMPVGENQAKYWMKLARREHPEGGI